MAKAPYLGKDGTVDLDDEIFGEEFHMPVVHETVRAELNARRRGTQSTKTRGEVKMSGAKAFRQKGTGRARAGALSVPHRYGGGVAFGPKPRHYTVKVDSKDRRRAPPADIFVHAAPAPRHYTVKVNRKPRRRALRAALSVHAARDSVAVIDASAYETPSPKTA